jgi:hypothetical protein
MPDYFQWEIEKELVRSPCENKRFTHSRTPIKGLRIVTFALRNACRLLSKYSFMLQTHYGIF